MIGSHDGGQSERCDKVVSQILKEITDTVSVNQSALDTKRSSPYCVIIHNVDVKHANMFVMEVLDIH